MTENPTTQNKNVMNRIFLTYVTNFADGDTRGRAPVVMMHQLELAQDLISQEESSAVVKRCLAFAEQFSKCWFWNRAALVAKTVRSILNQ